MDLETSISLAKDDLRKLVVYLAYADQHPELWAELPPGSREAAERRVKSLKAFLAIARLGRVTQPPSSDQVRRFVERVHLRYQKEALRRKRLQKL